MSTSESLKCIAVNDSNIPLPKRIRTGAKKSKGCAQLPELQKYIDTIIKTSNEYKFEPATVSEKEKSLKDRKLGRNTVYKGYDNKIKLEKVHFDLNLNRHKIKNKPKTPFSEAVSNGVEISNKFVCEFEDPRNWKFDRCQNPGHSLEIESFLKKLYPNPYHLTSVNKHQNVKSDSVDDLREGTLPDIDISKVDTNTELVIEKTNLVNALIEIKPSKRKKSEERTKVGPVKYKKPEFMKTFFVPFWEKKDHSGNKLSRAHSLENTSRPSPRTDSNFENSKGAVPTILSINSSKQFFGNKSSNSTSNVSSRAGSLESMNDILKKESSTNFRKRKNLKIKTTVSSESLHEACKSKRSTTKTHAVDENPNDFGIGKLELLNVSDSDDSATKKSSEIKISNVDLLNDAGSDICEEILKSSDLNELLQIYDIMNKATESFLLLSTRNDLKELELGIKSLKEDKKVKFLSSLKEEEGEEFFKEIDDSKANIEPEETYKAEAENSNKVNECSVQETFKKEEGKTSGKSLLNLLLEEEKEQFAFKKTLDKSNLDETETISEKTEKELLNMNDPKQKHDDVDSDSDQKVDEVLQFMYDCLKKFGVKENPLIEEEKTVVLEDKPKVKKTNSVKQFSKEIVQNADKSKNLKLSKKNDFHSAIEKNSESSLFSKRFPSTKEIHSRYFSILNECKKPISRTRCKKRSDALAQLERKISRSSSSYETSFSGTEISAEGLDAPCVPYPDSLVTTHQNCIQTVETHNELGSYTEETQEPALVCSKDLRIAKSILPLPLKIKKGKTGAYKTLKDVLETEEKLLAGEFNLKESFVETKPVEKNKDLVVCQSANQCLPNKNTSSAVSLVSRFNRQNSNFVICLNSFNKNLRTIAALRPKVSVPFSISTTDVRCWNIRPLPFYSKSFLKKFSLTSEKKHVTSILLYSFKEEILFRMNKTVVEYNAVKVCMKVITGIAKPEEEFLMKLSQCMIQKLQIHKTVELNVSETSTPKQITSKSNLTSLSKNDIDLKIEDKPINVVKGTLEETEEKVLLLENHSQENSHSLDRCNKSETFKNETLENELEAEKDKKKVQDLLLRTFNLQQRLHSYLHKMTYVQPTLLSCPLIQQEPFLDFGFFIENKADSDVYPTEFGVKPKNSFPLLHWCLQPPVSHVKSRTDETLTVKIQRIDQGTTYNPPAEDSNERTDKVEDTENDEDDSSSVYSFKSSNDFSEINEIPNEPSNRVANGEFIKNILNKIDSFKETFKEKILEKEQKHNSDNSLADTGNIKERKENRLVEYDSKTPAKVLKTVFKGRKSVTELTIGLKDVPMTKVSNISVEKTKFSPNHTKISICISKENPVERRQVQNTDNDILHNEFSSYCFDTIRPSLSTRQTEYTRLEEDFTKSSESLNGGSEDDEDDYKSAGSTVNSDTEIDNEERSVKEKKPHETAEEPPSKNFTKHKFDFYRKMDLTFDKKKLKKRSESSSLCNFKELEPLKEALTEMQIRMRGIQRDAVLNSADYYDRALKLAKMSAGYCQSCGTRAVIPNDTFGFYKTLLHRRYTHHRRNKQFRTTIAPNSSFYSFRSSMAEVGDRYCNLDIKHSSSYLLNKTGHLNKTVLRSSLHDMPILFEKI